MKITKKWGDFFASLPYDLLVLFGKVLIYFYLLNNRYYAGFRLSAKLLEGPAAILNSIPKEEESLEYREEYSKLKELIENLDSLVHTQVSSKGPAPTFPTVLLVEIFEQSPLEVYELLSEEFIDLLATHCSGSLIVKQVLSDLCGIGYCTQKDVDITASLRVELKRRELEKSYQD